MKEANLRVAGYPKFENTKDLEFSATFEIYPEVKHSDHCPVYLDIKL